MLLLAHGFNKGEPSASTERQLVKYFPSLSPDLGLIRSCGTIYRCVDVAVAVAVAVVSGIVRRRRRRNEEPSGRRSSGRSSQERFDEIASIQT